MQSKAKWLPRRMRVVKAHARVTKIIREIRCENKQRTKGRFFWTRWILWFYNVQEEWDCGSAGKTLIFGTEGSTSFLKPTPIWLGFSRFLSSESSSCNNDGAGDVSADSVWLIQVRDREGRAYSPMSRAQRWSVTVFIFLRGCETLFPLTSLWLLGDSLPITPHFTHCNSNLRSHCFNAFIPTAQ